MNRTTIASVISLIVGGIIGSGATYLYLKKDFEKRMNDEVDALHNVYGGKCIVVNPSDDFGDDEEEEEYHDTGDISPNITFCGSEKDLEQKLAEAESPQDDEPEDDDEADEEPDDYNERAGEEATKVYSMSKKNRPYIIKTEDFGSEPGYGEETIYYYMEDGAVVNDNDEEIDTYETMLGNTLTKYGFDKNDEHSIYVRNPNLEMDYEIIKVYQAFNPVSPED